MSLKKFLFAITFISIAIVISIAGYLFFVKSNPVQAQVSTNHYIRSGATGLNNGSDWSNAYTTLPATLIRGDIYYIADGDYPTYKVDDAVSGTSVITIKKAIIADHGTEVGWDNIFGDGQAVFAAPFNIVTSYVVFDGVVGSLSSNPDNYGFKIAIPTNCPVNNNNLIGIPPQGYSTTLAMSDINISHVALIHCGPSYDTFQNGIYSFPLSGSNMKVSHNYFLNASNNMLIRRWSNSTIEYNYFAGNWSSAASHGQQISPAGNSHDIFLRNNIFKNSSIFVLGVHQDNNYNWDVYNNITIGGSLSGWIVNADISSQTTPSIKKWNVHHNTFIDVKVDGGGYGAMTVGPLADEINDRSYFYNNLFYNTYRPTLTNLGYGTGALLHSHNVHFNTTGSYDSNESGTAQIGSGDPFINSANNDFRLKEATNPGLALSSPFDKDFLGSTRGSDGVWDRGAYEYIQAQPLKGDFNSDSKVNDLDFTSFKNAFFSIFNSIFDLNSDSTIDVKDLGVLMSGWLP